MAHQRANSFKKTDTATTSKSQLIHKQHINHIKEVTRSKMIHRYTSNSCLVPGFFHVTWTFWAFSLCRLLDFYPWLLHISISSPYCLPIDRYTFLLCDCTGMLIKQLLPRNQNKSSHLCPIVTNRFSINVHFWTLCWGTVHHLMNFHLPEKVTRNSHVKWFIWLVPRYTSRIFTCGLFTQWLRLYFCIFIWFSHKIQFYF